MKTQTHTLSRAALAKQTWLLYFNDYLRDKGIITIDEWKKMHRKIVEYKAGGTQLPRHAYMTDKGDKESSRFRNTFYD